MQTPTATMKGKPLRACDDCRTLFFYEPRTSLTDQMLTTGVRKLKCPGEPERCSRCIAEGISCQYSPRKTMGRPRKRRREGEGHTYDDSPEVGAAEDGKATAGTAGQDQSIAAFSDNGRGNNEISYFGNSLEAYGGFGLEPNSPHQDVLDVGFPADLTFDPTTGFSTWSSSQGLDDYLPQLSNDGSQLQTPPDASNDSNANKATATYALAVCSCLPNLYSTLASFQSSAAPSFPYSMGKLRRATGLVRDAIRCQCCPQSYNTAVQNAMMLCTLLHLVIKEYVELLKYIDERSRDDSRITFRLAESSSTSDPRHTGTPDCPMSVNVDLNGEEWRMLARKAVRQEIIGYDDKSDCLVRLVQEMRDRQSTWHEPLSRGESPDDYIAPDHERCGEKSEQLCVQMLYIDRLRRTLEELRL